MKSDRERLEELYRQGEAFTYENFSTKSSYGYPDSFDPRWIDWTTNLPIFIEEMLGGSSPAFRMAEKAGAVPVKGNGPDKFSQAKAFYLGAINSALRTLDRTPVSEPSRPEPSEPIASEISKRVFIVHGHDEKAKSELEILLGEIGLEPVVLHRQPDEGKTVIEKFEKHSDVGYAFILLTPDDIGYPAIHDKQDDVKRPKEYRARSNVIFEFGYFVGRLGRANVCCIYTGNVTLPSDVHGLIYKKFSRSIEEIAYSITKELKAKGYKLK